MVGCGNFCVSSSNETKNYQEKLGKIKNGSEKAKMIDLYVVRE